MAEAEREEIETDFVRTKVKATQRSIDEPTGIDIGMFDLDVDLLDGRRLDELQETRLLPTRCLFGGIKLSSGSLISCVAGSGAVINYDRSTN